MCIYIGLRLEVRYNEIIAWEWYKIIFVNAPLIVSIVCFFLVLQSTCCGVRSSLVKIIFILINMILFEM